MNAPDLGLMMTARSLEGSSVVNLSGDEVARIEGLFIEPKTGRVELVALKFLHDGNLKMKALPWSALAFEDGQAILDTNRIQVEEAPDVDASLLAPPSGVTGPKGPAAAKEPEPVEALRGYAPLKAYERRFDPASVETLRGTLKGTVKAPIGDTKTVDEMAFLETGDGDNVLLALAPSWYLESKGLPISPAEDVTVTGSRVETDVGDLLVVTTIRAGDRTVELRTKSGAPLWKR